MITRSRSIYTSSRSALRIARIRSVNETGHFTGRIYICYEILFHFIRILRVFRFNNLKDNFLITVGILV